MGLSGLNSAIQKILQFHLAKTVVRKSKTLGIPPGHFAIVSRGNGPVKVETVPPFRRSLEVQANGGGSDNESLGRSARSMASKE